MGLLEEMKNSFQYSDLPKELHPFVAMYENQDNQIPQCWAEKTIRKTGGGIGFTCSPKSPTLRKDPVAALAGTVAGYTTPVPMDFSADRRKISAEERAKRFVDGRYLYCGGFDRRAAECVARKKAQTFKAAGAEVKEVGTGLGSKESRKDLVSER